MKMVWKADKVFMDMKAAAIGAVRERAETMAAMAKKDCPVDPDTIRPPVFSDQDVSFTPLRGRGKGKLVSFRARVWMGRKPGDLQSTIRVVEKPENPGNFKVIAGNFKIYWARFVEYGTSRSKAKPFMRKNFDAIKPTVAPAVAAKVREVTK